jgi:hypothetical protein
LVDFFINVTLLILLLLNELYGPEHIPFLKKKFPMLGYRLYFLTCFNSENIYINFIRRQPLGYDNMGIEKRKELHDAILIERNNISLLLKLEDA